MRSPLWEMIKAGDDRGVIDHLSHRPAELQRSIFLGEPPLHWAAERGRFMLVQVLLEMGADVNSRGERGEQAAISAACSSAQPQIVKLLLDAGAELDVGTALGNPLFTCICCVGFHPSFDGDRFTGGPEEKRERMIECAKILIDGGIDLTATYNQRSMVDMDASAFATMWGLVEVTEMILQKLYGHEPRLYASAWAEAREVATGNAWSRQKFRRWRYPPRRGKNKNWRPPIGEYWEAPGLVDLRQAYLP